MGVPAATCHFHCEAETRFLGGIRSEAWVLRLLCVVSFEHRILEMCCILFFDDSPVEDGPRYGYGKEWDTNMIEAPVANCPWFCIGYL